MEKQNSYHYKDCGLDYVYLLNGFDVIDHPEMGRCISIHDIDGLNKTIIKFISEELPCIRGQEVRFIRSFLRFSQTQISTLIGNDMRTIQRWEEERDKPIPKPSDKFLKLFLSAHLDGSTLAEKICDILKEIKEENTKIVKKENYRKLSHMEFCDTSNGWKMSA